MYARCTGQSLVIFALLSNFCGSVLSLPKHARDLRGHLISRSNNSESMSARNLHGQNDMTKRDDTVLLPLNGEATYYYEKDGSPGGCGPFGVTVGPEGYPERNGYPKCLGNLPNGAAKMLKDYNTNMIVALGADNFDFKYCGKELRVAGSNDHRGYIIWDMCADCPNGFDFSSTEMHKIFGEAGCQEGTKRGIQFEILDNTLMEPVTDENGNFLTKVLDDASVEKLGADKACKLAESNLRRCTADGTATEWCRQWAGEGAALDKAGLMYWGTGETCAAGTSCKIYPGTTEGFPDATYFCS